jgi:transcriptional regulator with XRE-family HTH domain
MSIPNERLTEQRRLRGWSQNQVADRMHLLEAQLGLDESGVDGNQVSRWERRKVVPDPRSTTLLCSLYGLSPSDLGLADYSVSGSSGAQRPSGSSLLGAYPAQGSESLDPEDDPVNRREFNTAITITADESARFVRRAGLRVDADVLAQIDAEIAVVARQYLGYAPYALFKPIAQLRRDVFALLDAHHPPRHVTQLYFAGAELSCLLAHLTTDLDCRQVAETHCRTAWLCADLCGHDGLRTYARWVQAQIAYWSGRYRQAAEIARSARPFATDRASMLRITSQEARAWAAAGEVLEAEHALAAGAVAGELVESKDLAGVFRFPAGKAAYYASEVHLALGGPNNARRALTAAEESLSMLADCPDDDSCPEYVAAAYLDLVLAHLALSSFDGALEHLLPVLEMPPDHRTLQVIGRTAKVAAALARYASEPPAVEMREQIQLFAAHTAAQQITAAYEHNEEG